LDMYRSLRKFRLNEWQWQLAAKPGVDSKNKVNPCNPNLDLDEALRISITCF